MESNKKMRIISGVLKGRVIDFLKNTKTRPLKDRVKESIFNIIIHSKKFNIEFSNSNVLDLFSGVGSFGIECLSRGAKKVIFIENYHLVLKILERNLNFLNSCNKYEIIKKDIYDRSTFSRFNYKFNIIFLDPPFKEKKLNYLFNEIINKKIICKNSIFILHRHKRDNDNFPTNLKIIEKKIYGLSKIIFLSVLK